ncbi:hypothetical protein [Streptomyces radiopugnans]|uniref:hypothetical protein n=1 Tax=Streptomyces radiopugnans TaxID=403935 RepID=UPI003F1A591F
MFAYRLDLAALIVVMVDDHQIEAGQQTGDFAYDRLPRRHGEALAGDHSRVVEADRGLLRQSAICLPISGTRNH